MKKANKNNLSVVRILQLDVWNDKNNWKDKLKDFVKKYDKPKNIFICNNNEYESYS